MIEARGRTGRKPSAKEKGSSRSSSSRSSDRGKRYDKPPTWKGSAIRAVVAAAIVFAVSALLVKHTTLASKLVLLPDRPRDLHADDLLHATPTCTDARKPARRSAR